MRKYLIINLVFVLFVMPVLAQNVTVTGKLNGFDKGSLVRIMVPADLFSRLESTVATTYSNKSGEFTFHFDLDHPVYAQLAVNLKKGSLFLEPGKIYQVEIARDTSDQSGSIFDQQPLEINLLQGNTNLSVRLGSFNEMYNDFLLKHFRDIYLYHNNLVLNTFKRVEAGQFSNDTSLYLKNYIRYSLASLEWAARGMSLQNFGKAYFIGHKVLYDNVQYVEVFRDFFKAFFESTLHDPVTTDKLAEIISLGNIEKLDDLFAKVPLLKTDARVMELAEMISLEKYFYDNDFNRWNILRLFDEMSLQSKFSENRAIAHDFYVKLKRLIPGSMAPNFKLPAFNGREFSLVNFKHKFVLLAFFKTHNQMCESQLSFLKSLSDHEYDDFTPVVIVVGKDPDYYLKADLSQQYPWPFLLLGKDILLLERYQVMTYPSYVLINPDGSIAMAPAPMPEENGLQRIPLYITQYKKRVKN